MLMAQVIMVWCINGEPMAKEVTIGGGYQPMPLGYFDASKGFPGEGPENVVQDETAVQKDAGAAAAQRSGVPMVSLFQGLEAIWLRHARTKAAASNSKVGITLYYANVSSSTTKPPE